MAPRDVSFWRCLSFAIEPGSARAQKSIEKMFPNQPIRCLNVPVGIRRQTLKFAGRLGCATTRR